MTGLKADTAQRVRRLMHWGIAAVCVATMTGVGPSRASAAPEPAGADEVVLAKAQVLDPASGRMLAAAGSGAADTLADYWTPARMAAAVPETPDATVDVSAALAALAPAGKDASAPAGDTAAGSTIVPSAPPAAGDRNFAAMDAAFSITTGKVFATYPWRTTNKDIACSGAAVASARRRLVVTAAHCVYDAPGHGFAVNWVFIPGFQNHDQNPHGRFGAITMGVRSNWTNDRNFHSDYAFVVAANSDRGQRVVDAVGGHGVHFNGGYPDVHIIGYPGSGGYQTTCETSTTRASVWEDFIQGNCRMRGGSSGGPWLRAFDHATGRGNVATVTSFDDPGEPTHLFAPDFDSNALELYNATEGRSPTS